MVNNNPTTSLSTEGDSLTSLTTQLIALKPFIIAGLCTSAVACLLLLILALVYIQHLIRKSSDLLPRHVKVPHKPKPTRHASITAHSSHPKPNTHHSTQDFEINPYPTYFAPSIVAAPSIQNHIRTINMPEFEDADMQPDSASSHVAVVSEDLPNGRDRFGSDRRSVEASRSVRTSVESRLAQKLEKMLRDPVQWRTAASPS